MHDRSEQYSFRPGRLKIYVQKSENTEKREEEENENLALPSVAAEDAAGIAGCDGLITECQVRGSH